MSKIACIAFFFKNRGDPDRRSNGAVFFLAILKYPQKIDLFFSVDHNQSVSSLFPPFSAAQRKISVFFSRKYNFATEFR